MDASFIALISYCFILLKFTAFFKCACIAFIVFKNIILNVFIHNTIINHVDAFRKPMYLTCFGVVHWNFSTRKPWKGISQNPQHSIISFHNFTYNLSPMLIIGCLPSRKQSGLVLDGSLLILWIETHGLNAFTELSTPTLLLTNHSSTDLYANC